MAQGPEAPVILGPNAVQRQPSRAELEVLSQIGEHWRAALGGRRPRRSQLPIDPDLKPPPLSTRRYERILQMEPGDGGFAPVHPGELIAGTRAIEAPTRLGRAALAARRFVVGPPLATTALVDERLSASTGRTFGAGTADHPRAAA